MKKLLSMLLTGAITIGPLSVANVFSAEPDGTQENPYLIGSAAEWRQFVVDINKDETCGEGKYWKLSADIDFIKSGGKDWVDPIGNCDRTGAGTAFKGHLDGDGHVIKNYEINCGKSLGDFGAYGLFSGIGGDAVIENLGIEDASIRMGSDWQYVSSGAVAGVVTDNAQITNCYVKNISDRHDNENGHYSYRGGMAGRLIDSASITNCYSIGYSFTERSCCTNGGGIVGTVTSTSANIANCYSDTTIANADAGDYGSGWLNLYYLDTADVPWPGVYWSQNKPIGYIGKAITSDELKAIPAEIKHAFAVDTDKTNNGYPVLRWQSKTYDNEHIINNIDDFYEFATVVNNDPNGGEGDCWKLAADIDFGGAEWKTFIGTYDYDNKVSKPFKGTFDGDGHVIKNYVVKCEFKKMTGLFGAIGGNAVIKNVGIKNAVAKITKDWVWSTAGGLVGSVADNAAVQRCYAKNVTLGIDNFIEGNHAMSEGGALVGIVSGSGKVENCYSLGTNITNTNAVVFDGGIAGYVEDSGTILNCYSDTTIAVSPKNTATVDNCYYTELPAWPWNDGADANSIYRGTKLSSNTELKKLAPTLGYAFNSDSITSSINDGYPVLAWEYDVPALTGSGTQENPYKINSVDDLSLVLSYDQATDKYFRLMEDLDFGGNVWTMPIGDRFKPWEGTLDGNGHSIKNYVLQADEKGKISHLGLFGSLSGNARIYDLGIENVTIGFAGDWGYNTVCGALAGSATGNASIERCYAKNITFNNNGNMNCSFSVAGGLLGIADGAGVAVKDCYALDVKSENDCAASESGLVGQLINFAEVSNCYSNTTVSMCDDSEFNKVSNTYYANETASAYDRIGTLLSDDVLKTISFYLGSAYKANGNGYPMLVWENSNKDVIRSVVLADKNNETVTDLNTAEKIKAVNIDKTGAKNGKLYIAAYDKDGKLQRVTIAERTVENTGEYAVDMVISDAERISAFVLTDSLEPLTEAYSIIRLH